MRLGLAQLVVPAGGLALVLLVARVAFFPDWHDEYVKRVAIGTFERTYGFKTGALRVQPPAGGPITSWGIVLVAAGGEFARLGVREGDVPWGRDGHGPTLLYKALVEARDGRIGTVDVFNARDVRTARLREIKLPPRTN